MVGVVFDVTEVSIGVIIVSGAGAVVSIVIVLDTTLLILPAESVRVTLNVVIPSLNGRHGWLSA
jgi:hypothetical protein